MDKHACKPFNSTHNSCKLEQQLTQLGEMTIKGLNTSTNHKCLVRQLTKVRTVTQVIFILIFVSACIF